MSSITPSTISEIQLIIKRIPKLLKWNIEEDDSKTLSFSTFSELPFEVQSKIIGIHPNLSITNTFRDDYIVKEAFFNTYCLAMGINRQELINFFDSQVIGSRFNFQVWKLYQDKIAYDTYRFIKSNNGVYVNKAFYNRQKSWVVNKGNGMEIVDTITSDPNIKCILFNPVLINQIVTRRESCQQVKYTKLYIKNYLETFLSYFAPYPLIIFEYISMLKNDEFDADDSYYEYIQNLRNAVINFDNSLYARVDMETQTILSAHYQNILHDYLIIPYES